MALLAIASVVQPYIFAMVGAIWVADLVKRRWQGETTWPILLCEIGLSIGFVAISLWLAGFFSIASGRKEAGFGSYYLDLLGPLDPKGWSSLPADFPYKFGPGESLSFLGLGVILLIALSLPALSRGAAAPLLTRRLLPLLAALLALTLYAMTDHVTLAGKLSITPSFAGVGRRR